MSGIISEDRSHNMTQRYHQRFNELLQVNTNISSVAPSTDGRSLVESLVDGQYYNNREQRANGTINTQQFYLRNSNQDSSQFQSGNIPSKSCMGSLSTCTGASDASIFKKPFPVKKISCSPHYQRKIELLMELLHGTMITIDDKKTIKFAMTTIETLVHSLKNPPMQPVNPVVLMKYISSLVEEEYFSKQVPKSICGSSVMSDQASNIDQYSNRLERSIRLDRPFQNSASSDSIRPERSIRLDRPFQTSASSDSNGLERSIRLDRPFQTSASSDSNRPDRSIRLDKPIQTSASSANLGQMHKNISLLNGTGVSRCGPVREAPVKPWNSKANLDQTDKNISVLNGTATGVSRCGRIRKAPVKYWNSKGEELSFREPDESVFNDSMTLRNKKVIDKKKTPPLGSKNKTPLMPIAENDKSSMKKPRGRAGRKSLSTEKENVDLAKKKTVKKQSDTAVRKNTSAKGKTNKKKEVVEQNKEKTEKKPAPKRKSKESNAAVASKKKKIEDHVEDVLSDDDDLFGVVNYKKPTYQKTAVSPSAGLLSAKKAAEAAQGKATPPCKAIGDMMMNESILSAMSAAKEAPKKNEAVKRIIKKIQKTTTEPAKTTQVKKAGKEDNNLMREKSTFSVNNPLSSATLTVFRGTELESDFSDMEQDDDDDDDLM